MSFPLNFQKFEAVPLSKEPAVVLIKWELMPTRLPLSDFEFYIDRADAPDQIPAFQHVTIDGKPMKDLLPTTDSTNLFQIAGPVNALDFYEYRDFTPLLRNFWKTLYYRIRCRRISTQEEISTPAFSWEGSLDLVGLYIVDETNFLLEDTTGVPSLVHIRKRGGVPCQNCFDPIQKKRTLSNCTVCFGTNWTGGFFRPIDLYIDFNPSPNQVAVKDWGETQPNQTDIKISNYPQLSPGDIVRELRKQRLWRIVAVQETEKRRVPMLQFARVVEINSADIEYKIPYDQELGLAALKKFDEMRMKREF